MCCIAPPGLSEPEELKGMEQVMQANHIAGVAQRVGGQYQSLMSTVQREYQMKVKNLEETIARMKDALSKKSKKAEKLKLRAQDLGEDAQDMVELLGESETMKSKLEALMEEPRVSSPCLLISTRHGSWECSFFSPDISRPTPLPERGLTVSSRTG